MTRHTNVFIQQRREQTSQVHGERPALVVPLSWAATTATVPFANLGDALSPVIVSALSGLPVMHHHFDARTERLTCVGSIGHQVKHGTIHLWGTGARARPLLKPPSQHWNRLVQTHYCVHALRGPLSAQLFQQQGLDIPDVYGDPVWFLPAIVPPAPEKKYELGIIVHLSELNGGTDRSTVNERFLRYHIPDALASQVRIITTITRPSFDALEEKLHEITACKRIASTSLHGLVLAETYRIPCVYFRTQGRGVAFPHLKDETERIDLRMRDFYRGIGSETLFVYGQPRPRPTNWEHLIQAIDTHWIPIHWSAESFLERFPLPLAFNPLIEQLGDRTRFQSLQL
ncbi:polysaccharide pyruvyl transferase family protein [Oculatella sp. LEGE 06141]|uniref:polysaccharide pyruvyl transferase family protein n=1 Tax=Oculatella sp. LEGE 06141 TaxID=1828648 RepID=UPI0018801E7B|nr:polysaccharide pyruvyl transferase family protein [Oculatella sp. LEGE 06141]